MALVKGHGKGKLTPRIEVLPPDQLPIGVADFSPGESPAERLPGGRFAKGNTIAKAKGGRTRLAERLGIIEPPIDGPFGRYMRSAVSFRRAVCATLAASVGGGVCGPGPSSIVASAALTLAWSRYMGDQAAASGDTALALQAARLSEVSRVHLMAAHELCAKEAEARARRVGHVTPHQALLALESGPPSTPEPDGGT